MQNEYYLKLDLKKSLTNPTPTFVSNDTAVLYITVTDNGADYDISTVERFTVSFLRPDGELVSGLGTLENGMLKYQLGSTEMKYQGMLEAVAQFYKGNMRVSTKSFKVKIIHDYEGGIDSTTDLTMLQQLFVDVHNNGDYAKTQGDYAKSKGDNLVHKGDYNSSTSYKSGNIVVYGGISYICLQDAGAGINPLQGAYWSVIAPQARFNSQSWTATEGQSVFTLANGSYVPNSGNIEVFVGGVPQTSGIGYEETNSTTITLAEGVSASTIIYARWVEGAFTISKAHNSTHYAGGQDELDVTKLKNINLFPKTAVGSTAPTDGSLFWIDESVQ